MSRVDEALRRAGGGAGSEEPSGFAKPRLSVEEYPSEMPGSPLHPARHAPARELPAAVAAPRSVGGPSLTRLAPEVEGKIVIDQDTSPASIEEYRRLATTLHLRQAETGLQVLMISSALPRDGKTLTSTNLALTLSESYRRRVLLIDADLRRPSIHEVFRVPNATGLADALRAETGGAFKYLAVSANLALLTAGNVDGAPMAALTSERMRGLVAEARRHFEWVIIDTPPVGLISDANILASLADGVLLVIGASTTPFPAVQRAVADLGRERLLGVVLNRVSDDVTPNTYYHHYYPAYGAPASEGA